MDTGRFDRLIRTLANERSRRGAVRLLAGGLVAGLLTRRETEPAGAQFDFRCLPGWTRCGDRCSELQYDSENCGWCGNVCPQGQYCSQRVCVIALPLPGPPELDW